MEDSNDSDLLSIHTLGITFIYLLTHHLFSKDSTAVRIVALVSKGTKITWHSICL